MREAAGLPGRDAVASKNDCIVARLQQWAIHRLDQICALQEGKHQAVAVAANHRGRSDSDRQQHVPPAVIHNTQKHNKAAALWPASATWAQQQYQFGHPTELVSSTMPLH